jgi:mediator of DNA damage checkpoint protein 1
VRHRCELNRNQQILIAHVSLPLKLPTADLEVLSAGITALGGLFRMGLTRDVTHLFALTSSSAKYETAMHFREHTNIKVLLPHWFDDAVRLGYGDLDTAVYEWPNPRVLEPDMGISLLEKDRARDKDRDPDKDREKKALFKGLHWSPPGKDKGGVERDVWEGRKILLGDSLQLIEGRRQAVEAGIQRAGGVVVTGDIEHADILITRYRAGKVYLKVGSVSSILCFHKLMSSRL